MCSGKDSDKQSFLSSSLDLDASQDVISFARAAVSFALVAVNFNIPEVRCFTNAYSLRIQSTVVVVVVVVVVDVVVLVIVFVIVVVVKAQSKNLFRGMDFFHPLPFLLSFLLFCSSLTLSVPLPFAGK